ncbi:MAG: hypothetical protein IPM70_11620 [Proteobacteria bacterium]|nr:hypothetical protein [Pseudomonadota bacterium]
MNNWTKTLLALLVAATATGAAIAHHSFAAEFDGAKKLKLTGTVTKVQWRNPHTYFFVDVKGEDGQIHNWAMELGSPNVLMRRGWTRDSLKIGDQVTIEARARATTATRAMPHRWSWPTARRCSTARPKKTKGMINP